MDERSAAPLGAGGQGAGGGNAGWVQGVLLALAPCMLVMTMVAPIPVIPAMRRAFAGLAGVDMLVQLCVVLPTLAIALSSLAAGALGDLIGRRRLLDVSTLVFALSAVAPFWLSSFPLILVSRAVAGIALGAMSTSAVGLTGDYFTGAVRQRWLAIQGGAGAASAVVSSLVSGALGAMGWRLVFLQLGLGFVLFLLLILFRGPAWAGKDAARPQGDLEGGGDAAPWALLAGIIALGVFASLSIWPPTYELGLMMEEKSIGSTVLTGVVTSVLAAGAIAGALSLDVLRRLPALGKLCLAFGVSGAGVLVLWGSAHVLPVMAGALAVGFGQGLTAPVLSVWMLDLTPPNVRGRIVGLFQTIFFLAQFAGPLIARWAAQASASTTASLFYYGAAPLGAAALIVAALASRRERLVRRPI